MGCFLRGERPLYRTASFFVPFFLFYLRWRKYAEDTRKNHQNHFLETSGRLLHFIGMIFLYYFHSPESGRQKKDDDHEACKCILLLNPNNELHAVSD